MFLALNEIKHSKLRYTLVIGVMFLIAYLVFFLTGLAYGLAQENRMGIDKWQADNILLSSEANDNLNMSMIDPKDFDKVDVKDKAELSQLSGIVYREGNKSEKENVSFFGINPDQFITPEVTEGKLFTKDNEVVADESLKINAGYKIGDTIILATNEEELTITGFTKNAKFNVAPILYTTLDTVHKLKYGERAQMQPMKLNAIVTKGKLTDVPSSLQRLTISTFINKLPGYNAQVLTFGFMIGFLVVIVAVVIGIFIYVLTMQKTAIFGVMKAQGISSSYIARSVIAQTFFLAVVGVGIGLLATIGSGLVLPEAVPFQSNALFFAAVSMMMVVVAIIGAFFSVRTIVKIDPLKAIS